MSKLILIAEDDPFISRMYTIKLESAGYAVSVKTNGRDAFEGIKAENPQLVLLDINMPEMTGLEVLDALQHDNVDVHALPLIVLTNSSTEEDRTRAESFGAEYVVKAELTPRQVLNKIDAKLANTEEAV